MGRSLNHQAKYVLFESQAFGKSKHQDKANGVATTEKIYSIESFRDQKRIVENFTKHVRENFPEIKQLNQLEAKHVQSFLNNKAQGGCNMRTLNHYKSVLASFGDKINNVFGKNIDLRNNVKLPAGKVSKELNDMKKVHVMTKDEFAKLEAKALASNNAAKYVPSIINATGARLGEAAGITAESINLKDRTVTFGKKTGIDTKGGRTRTVTFKPEHDAIMKEIKEKCQHLNDKGFHDLGTSRDAVRKAMQRMNPSNGASNQSHSIRKKAANERYRESLAEGKSELEAKRDVAEFLGHGRHRVDLVEEFYLEK